MTEFDPTDPGRRASTGTTPRPQTVRLDLDVGGHRLVADDRPLIMGVLNVTPDSFSDGGRFDTVEQAAERAHAIAQEGADLLDLGGESTRPGARHVPVEQEQQRVIPVIRRLREAGFPLPVSVDTRKGAVAAAAVKAGASIINDVSALADPAMRRVAADHAVGVVLMHMKGDPATMQRAPVYDDVVDEVVDFLIHARDRAVEAGVSRERIILDPGIGFGKRTGSGIEDNITLLSSLPRLAGLGQPLLVGASRKGFIGNLTGAHVDDRLPGSLVAAVAAAWGGASILRVHDVEATLQAVRLASHLDPTEWTTRWRRSG